MPVAVVFPCGVCCCISENIKNIIINRKTGLCHHRPQTKAHSNEYENKIIVLFQNLRIFLLDLFVGTAPQNMRTAPRFWRALPLFWETRRSLNMFCLQWNGDTWCWLFLFVNFFLCELPGIQQQTTRAITTATGTVAAGQQRTRAPITPAGAKPSR